MRKSGLFAGAGGSDLGYECAGFATALAVGYKKEAAAAYKANFTGHTLETSDVAAIDWLAKKQELGEIDLLEASPPCQPFSTTGARKKDDERAALIFEVARCAEVIQPKIIIIENVAALVSSSHSETFKRCKQGLKKAGH